MFLSKKKIKNIHSGVKKIMLTMMEQKTIKLVKKSDNTGNLNEGINYLLNIVQNADANIKNEIENRIVKIGVKAVPDLINCIQNNKGTSRGIAAMSLIRIGYDSVPFLKETAGSNKDFAWVADYLIKEIEGSQTPLAC
ncbi:MAG: hypothetical protein WC197_04945 [Candidatus Gastranaerophilaceae bacterium]|jgi:hypothetical protein